MDRLRHVLYLLALLTGIRSSAQAVIGDSTYLRIPDQAKAYESMRFDMDAYRDTLRVFRDAIETTATGINAIDKAGQEQKAKLGRLRVDVKMLDKEMKRQRKKLKRPQPLFEQTAKDCSKLVQRSKWLRTQLKEQGVRLR
ncbi:MAG: hypothetical protein JST41_05455 [Bacteroidetes bacterium]|jgi:hypothetical protein|nr:hypothetical protein [Bacteroidota bacterium]MBX7127801.1 hypothetical protein [Flavobacteriales bacterium]MCC6656094.1 hypothetical protein [Flavobacteriales bacterium]HMU12601.1 hypothetical protein [Flavobacteriales bacterium]HMW95907.1 hypothetical protein [Flavobacteriales bacterium]